MCCTDGPAGGDLRLRVGSSRAWGSCWKQSCRKQDLSQDTWGDVGRGSSSFDEGEEKLTDIRALWVWLSGMTLAAESSDCTAGCKLRRALHTSLWTPWTLYLFLSQSELWTGHLWLTAWNAHSLTELYKQTSDKLHNCAPTAEAEKLWCPFLELSPKHRHSMNSLKPLTPQYKSININKIELWQPIGSFLFFPGWLHRHRPP